MFADAANVEQGVVRVECLLTSDVLEVQWLERDEGEEEGSEDGG